VLARVPAGVTDVGYLHWFGLSWCRRGQWWTCYWLVGEAGPQEYR
jgi:hypothetical protein